MMSKSKTHNFALLKMAFILPLAMVLALIFSTSLSDQIIAQDGMQNDPKTIPQKQDPDVYTVVEKMPEYPGGEEARIKFLVTNIKYPPKARKEGIKGTVFVTFIIEKDGKITNVKALKGIGGGCDEEAVRVISMMPNWKPGMQRGEAVRVQFNMPIKFHLDEKGEKQIKGDQDKGSVPPPPKSENKKNDAPPPPPPPQSE